MGGGGGGVDPMSSGVVEASLLSHRDMFRGGVGRVVVVVGEERIFLVECEFE